MSLLYAPTVTFFDKLYLRFSISLRNVFFCAASSERKYKIACFRYFLCYAVRSFGNNNFLITFVIIKYVIRRIYIRYRIIGFKVCQVKFVSYRRSNLWLESSLSQGHSCRQRKAYRQRKRQWHVGTNTDKGTSRTRKFWFWWNFTHM